jgi:hypothetical protein
MSSDADNAATVTLYSTMVDPIEVTLTTDNCVNGHSIASLFGFVEDTVSLTLQGSSPNSETVYVFDLMQDDDHNMEVLPGRMYAVSGVLQEHRDLSLAALQGISRATEASLNMRGAASVEAHAGGCGDSAGGYGPNTQVLSEVENAINGNKEFIIEVDLPSKRWQQHQSLTDGRPWGRGYSTTNKDLEGYTGYMYKCEGGYICVNKSCPHAKTNTGNKGTQRFETKIVPDTDGRSTVVCTICEKSEVRKIQCACTKKLFRKGDESSVVVQHTGVHTSTCTRPLKTANALSPQTKDSLLRLTAIGMSPAQAKVKVLSQSYDETLAGKKTYEEFNKTATELGQDRAVQAAIVKARARATGAGAGVTVGDDKLSSIVAWKKQCLQASIPYLRVFNMSELDHTKPEYYFCMTTRQVKLAATIGKGDKFPRNGTMVHFDFKHNVIQGYKTMGAHFMCTTFRRIQTLAVMHSKVEDTEVQVIFWRSLVTTVKSECGTAFDPATFMADNMGANWLAVREVFGFDASKEFSCAFHFQQSVSDPF